MAHVVFLRAANVAGQGRFRPTVLASELAALDVVSLGAAGTFVVRAALNPEELEEAFAKRLPFATQIFVATGRDVLALLSSAPFGETLPEGAERHVSVLAAPPTKQPTLPLDVPRDTWRVRIVSVRPQFACSLWRAGASAKYYPNAIVERRLGVVATTRNWTTLEAAGRWLEPIAR